MVGEKNPCKGEWWGWCTTCVYRSSADNMVAIHEQSTPFNNQCSVLDKVHARVSWIQGRCTLRFKVFWMSGYNHEIILSFLLSFFFLFPCCIYYIHLSPYTFPHPHLPLYKNLIVPTWLPTDIVAIKGNSFTFFI